MGHDKLRKFAENETFRCLLQPSAEEVLRDGYFALRDHSVKGHWCGFIGTGPRPLTLELGCGKGEYAIALSQRNPGRNYVGVDIKGARLWKGAKFATENGLGNVAFLRTRIEFIEAFFGPEEVDEIWLTFSDPQIRKENARLTSPLFLERYRKFLKRGGTVHLKTDSRFLYEYTKAVCEVNGLKVLACTDDLYGRSGEDGITEEVRQVQTFYEGIFRNQGYRITYMAFTLDHDGAFVSPCEEPHCIFDAAYWRRVEGPRQLFGRDTAETRRQKLLSEETHSE